MHLLKNKESKMVNKHMRKYVLWADRQASWNVSNSAYSVKQVLTDKDGDFVNVGVETWYTSKGIEHVKVDPKSSQLDLCERTHQSLEGITKSTMAHAGAPQILCLEAMQNDVYVKSHVSNKGANGIP